MGFLRVPDSELSRFESPISFLLGGFSTSPREAVQHVAPFTFSTLLISQRGCIPRSPLRAGRTTFDSFGKKAKPQELPAEFWAVFRGHFAPFFAGSLR